VLQLPVLVVLVVLAAQVVQVVQVEMEVRGDLVVKTSMATVVTVVQVVQVETAEAVHRVLQPEYTLPAVVHLRWAIPHSTF
jgi:hypothetical protein